MNCCDTYKIDCNQGRTCPQNVPMHTHNGGNTISDGQALHKPVYTGNDVIEPPTSWFAVGALVSSLSLFAVFLVMAYRIGGV